MKAIFFGILGLSISMSVTAFADVTSDSVPDNQLVANFQVNHADADANTTFDVSFAQVLVANGQATSQNVTLSPDESLSFSVGATSVAFDPANPTNCALPYTADAVYTAIFKRASGETFTSTVTMPEMATISQPTAGAVFQKTDAVAIAWKGVTAAEAVFMISSTCGTTTGDATYSTDYTSAQIPAGYTTTCDGAVQMGFDALYVNIGTGYGSFAAVTASTVAFSYGAAPTPPATLSLASHRIMRQAVNAARHKVKTLKTLLK